MVKLFQFNNGFFGKDLQFGKVFPHFGHNFLINGLAVDKNHHCHTALQYFKQVLKIYSKFSVYRPLPFSIPNYLYLLD